MPTTVTGIFINSQAAGEAVADLKSKGYTNEISVVAKDEEGSFNEETVKSNVGSDAARGAGIGALVGGLAGVVLAAIPGAPLVVAGPIAAGWGLTGAALGALSGGLVAALVNYGLDQEEAEEYERRILRGEVMVAVTGDDSKASEIINLMKQHNVTLIHNIKIED